MWKISFLLKKARIFAVLALLRPRVAPQGGRSLLRFRGLLDQPDGAAYRIHSEHGAAA